MAANPFGAYNFGVPVAANAPVLLNTTKADLYPSTYSCRQLFKQTPVSKEDFADGLSTSKAAGSLYLEFESRYTVQVVLSEVLFHPPAPCRTLSFPTKFFPTSACEWPEKPEVVIMLDFTSCAHPHAYGGSERILIQQQFLDRYTLTLTATKTPAGYRSEFTAFEMTSTEKRAFCESVDGVGSTAVSAIVHFKNDGTLSLSFGLRLVALNPFKNAYEEGRSLSTRLLSSASKTGDVMLRSQGGTELPAHVAVLSDIPYFSARFGPDWRTEPESGKRSVCMLPVEASEESLATFLSYVYGEPHALDTIKSPARLQALFTLGEACDLPILCKDVARATKIQEDEVQDWIEWLGREHVSAVEPLREQLTVLVKQTVLAKKDAFWEHLSMEELSNIYNAAKRHKKDN